VQVVQSYFQIVPRQSNVVFYIRDFSENMKSLSRNVAKITMAHINSQEMNVIIYYSIV